MAVSSFDAVAPGFDRHRALPEGVAETVRSTVLGALDAPPGARPRLLDLGAGSGRFGWPFVAAGDDYVGVDLSAGMLRVFAARNLGRVPLVQADGAALPFPAGSFDAVLLIAVFGDLPDWRPLVGEARRVLRPRGRLILGRTATPEDGVDEIMKARLDALLARRIARPPRGNGRDDAARSLAAAAASAEARIAASWPVARSPRQFLDRHAGGARFSRLPRVAREAALGELAVWAERRFGGLDTSVAETHRFEMQLFSFAEG